jgi:hypothetical protein
MGEHFPTNFLGASNDGSSAFIFSLEPLTEDAAPGGGIYRFDLQTRSLTLLTPPAGSPDGFRLRNALPSDDMSHIYFNARSALDGGAVDGDENAYVWTQAGGVRFVGKVTAEDAFVNTTPDGRFALLSTAASIAGAPTNGKSSLYEYDDQSGELKCVTCRPDGSPSQGTATLNAQSPSIPACSCSHARGLTFDGRVFFTTDDSLVARDQNMVRDVYMYDNASGKVALISSGQSNIDSYLGENSDDGRHVFVVTRESLVGADRDPAEFDVYDAHVEGGFLEAAAPAAPCGGEACRTQTSATPVPASPTTQNFIGPGIPKPCAKGKTRRNGRCVKQRKPHKHKNKKHTKKHKGSHRDANSNRRTGR